MDEKLRLETIERIFETAKYYEEESLGLMEINPLRKKLKENMQRETLKILSEFEEEVRKEAKTETPKLEYDSNRKTKIHLKIAEILEKHFKISLTGEPYQELERELDNWLTSREKAVEIILENIENLEDYLGKEFWLPTTEEIRTQTAREIETEIDETMHIILKENRKAAEDEEDFEWLNGFEYAVNEIKSLLEQKYLKESKAPNVEVVEK